MVFLLLEVGLALFKPELDSDAECFLLNSGDSALGLEEGESDSRLTSIACCFFFICAIFSSNWVLI